MSKQGVALILAAKPGKPEGEEKPSSAAEKAASAAFDDLVSALGLDLDDNKKSEAMEALKHFMEACRYSPEEESDE